MSRGLSQQQRTILGIAAHVNRLTQGGVLAVKAVETGGVKDLQWPLAAHLVGGLPFVEAREKIEKTNGIWQDAGNFFDLRLPDAKSAKASVIRAISRLVRTGHLRYATQEAPFRWGYVLTEAGLALGRLSERPFAPPLIWRAGLLVFPDQAPYSVHFHALYGRLCRGACTLADVLAAFQALTPRPTSPVREAWHTLHREEGRRVLHALLGEEAVDG